MLLVDNLSRAIDLHDSTASGCRVIGGGLGWDAVVMACCFTVSEDDALRLGSWRDIGRQLWELAE